MTEAVLEPQTAAQTVEVHFKGNRREFFGWKDPADPLRLREAVIVETGRGLDFGRVTKVGELAARGCGASCSGCATDIAAPATPLPSVVRRAAQEDIATANELRRSEEEVRRRTIERVRHHNLEMRISDAEWQWDRSKVTIYFTAEKRVDFRGLVRDLAAQLRTRIELRQIGVRDEAARLTGVGRCGREYCCSTWLKELSPVSLALAKDQHLSLNPAQISGGCGRLLCCLKYEHEFYVTARRRFPKEGKAIRTTLGEEKVIAVDIFRERVLLRSEEHGSRTISLVQLREEVESLGALLPSPENRARLAPAAGERAPRPGPAAPPPTAPPAPEAQAQGQGQAETPVEASSPDPKRPRRRRRGRRGRGGPHNPSPPTPES